MCVGVCAEGEGDISSSSVLSMSVLLHALAARYVHNCLHVDRENYFYLFLTDRTSSTEIDRVVCWQRSTSTCFIYQCMYSRMDREQGMVCMSIERTASTYF